MFSRVVFVFFTYQAMEGKLFLIHFFSTLKTRKKREVFIIDSEAQRKQLLSKGKSAWKFRQVQWKKKMYLK